MKKIAIISIVFFMFSSCADWVDVEPRSEVRDKKLFEDETGFRNALLGVYNLLGDENLYGDKFTLSFLDVLAQYFDITEAQHSFFYVSKYDFSNTTARGYIEGAWKAAYTAIANINNLLANIDDVDADFFRDKRTYNLIKGEALALRAHVHFDILRLVAPPCKNSADAKAIPYVDKFQRTPFKQLTVAGVLKHCLEDLNAALSLLHESDPISPVFEVYSDGEWGRGLPEDATLDNGFFYYRDARMNYLATLTLKGRVCLYMEDYEAAAKATEEVLTSERVDLGSAAIFTLYKSNMTRIANTYFSGGMTGNTYLVQTQEKVQVDYEISTYGSTDLRMLNYFKNSTSAGASYRTVAKYSVDNQFVMPGFPIISGSEAAYIYAEASLKLGFKEKAVKVLNDVREKFGLGNSPLDVDLSEAQVLSEIVKEYRKRFPGEGQTFFCYKRLGYESSEIPNAPGIQMSEVYNLLEYLPVNEFEYGQIETK
ncbi:RagB/SusD family nutrient uptake outer membrane protein [Butyricimonas sp.]|uniref:RagB/SusD family nutrient uptake outer membrane protein n=1 Tax=Butyricimonas sp. TaxID=1969738 RepID=UPI0025C3D879|nr:RagB/SusD family nutrient uptake outer membrane protein [Butyricimonas sp.]